MSECNGCTECIPSLYGVCIECVPSVHRVCTECVPSMHRVCTEFTECTDCSECTSSIVAGETARGLRWNTNIQHEVAPVVGCPGWALEVPQTFTTHLPPGKSLPTRSGRHPMEVTANHKCSRNSTCADQLWQPVAQILHNLVTLGINDSELSISVQTVP